MPVASLRQALRFKAFATLGLASPKVVNRKKVVSALLCFYFNVRKNPHAVALGRRGGKATALALTAEERSANARKAGLVGSRARTEALTPEERSKIARKAAKARWKAQKQKPA